jgi:hypothetical protein
MMSNKESENIKDLKKEVIRYGYQDGVAEITIGVVYLFLGLVLFFYRATPIRPLYAIVFVLACLGVLFAGGIWLFQKLKVKFVWGKSGYYVTKGYYSKLVWVFLGLSLLSVAFAIISMRVFSSKIAIASFGGCFVFGLISQFFQTGGLKRFLYIPFVPLLIAIACILLEISWKQSLVFMFLSTGFVFLISGVMVYRAFRGRYE